MQLTSILSPVSNRFNLSLPACSYPLKSSPYSTGLTFPCLHAAHPHNLIFIKQV
ncbi:hypothetical protein XELAEV_18038267mg [Xenopus laevis]|uniref:Uncharacterized protein n=1 Tax=Xenopus laevis TaxID=8355 RepID=A0A974C5D7_XENLA|nr:hypothetical protein XELAEV_18038266mg [Xenopus laevis]OCT66985.1 hypothetical protein XELAEV_18038267mg [Xenopus laevis]